MNTNLPVWIGVVTALALVVNAAAFLTMAITVRRLTSHIAGRGNELAGELKELHAELRPTLLALGEFTTEGRDLTRTVRLEVEALVDTTSAIRTKVDDAATRVGARLEDLEALYDVLHEEVEDTALAVAATLRTARSGVGWLARVKYLFGRGDENGLADAVQPTKRRAVSGRKRKRTRPRSGKES